MESQQSIPDIITRISTYILRLRKHSIYRLAVLLVMGGLFASVVGCKDGGTPTGPDGITLEDLADTWNATQFEFSQAGEGPALEPFDVVAEGGSVTLEIQSNGRFTLTTVDPEGSSEIQTGKLGFDLDAEDFLLVVFDDEPDDELEFFFLIVNNNSFRLVDSTGEGEFDLDGDGVLDPARINSTWVR